MLAATAVASPPSALMPFRPFAGRQLGLRHDDLGAVAAMCSQIERRCRGCRRSPPPPCRSGRTSSRRLLAFESLDFGRPSRRAANSAINSTCRTTGTGDRQQFLQPVSASWQAARVTREAAGSPKRRPRATFERASSADYAATPARGDRAARHRSRDSAAVKSMRKDLGAPQSPPTQSRAPLRPRQQSACHSRTVEPSRPADRQRAHTGEQVGKPRRVAGPVHDRGAHGLFGAPGGQQEGPGRRLDAGLAKQKKRRVAATTARRRPVAPAQPRQLARRHARSASAVQRQVETLMRPHSRSMPVLARSPRHRRPRRPAKSMRRRPQGIQKRTKGRPGDDADADIDDARLLRSWNRQHAPALPAQHEVARRGSRRATRGASKPARRRHVAQRTDDQLDLPGRLGVAPNAAGRNRHTP